jgi:hypothetical protein
MKKSKSAVPFFETLATLVPYTKTRHLPITQSYAGDKNYRFPQLPADF